MPRPDAFSRPTFSPRISMPRSGSGFCPLNSVNCVNFPEPKPEWTGWKVSPPLARRP